MQEYGIKYRNSIFIHKKGGKGNLRWQMTGHIEILLEIGQFHAFSVSCYGAC